MSTENRLSELIDNIFYVYYLRRPDFPDPFDPEKGCPFYVGKGSNGRMGDHRCEANALLHRPGKKNIKISIIHKLWKQGLDFEEDIFLDGLTEQEAFDIEIEAIEVYGRKDLKTGCLANLTNGGEGASGAICSDKTKSILKEKRLLQIAPMLGKSHSLETKEKIGKKSSERKHTPETKKLIGSKSKGRIFIHTQESKDKISKAKKGVKQSPEHVEANRQAHIGYKHKEESKEKLSSFWKGKPKSKEHCENISKGKMGHKAGMTGKYHSEETKQNMRLAWERRRKRKSNKTRVPYV